MIRITSGVDLATTKQTVCPCEHFDLENFKSLELILDM